jgi:hypothetical protein
VPEEGAVLIRFDLAAGAPAPDELRLWVYADQGPLWSDQRVPSEGALPPPQGTALGTILVQPGAAAGSLRIHARGLAKGARVLDGVVTIPPEGRSSAVELRLDTPLPDDTDGDGVPDAVDDCRAVADPQQYGCAGGGDGGVDAALPTGCEEGSSCHLAPGASCSQDASCASGFCVDGVCCANACIGPCRSCNQPNADGVCQSYPSGTDPQRECGSATCNGAGACGSAPTTGKQNGSVCQRGSECTSGFCTDGVCCNEACGDVCRSCATGSCKVLKLEEDEPLCTLPKICDLDGKCIDLHGGR